MSSLREQLLQYLHTHPAGATDAEIAATLGHRTPQAVNRLGRALAQQGRVTREHDPATGRIITRLADPDAPRPALTSIPRPLARLVLLLPTEVRAFVVEAHALAEDIVTQAVAAALDADGWQVKVHLGQEHGPDICARRGAERWIIEAKGTGSRPQMDGNYFLAALGQLIQRMNTPDTRYALALPAHPQFAGLLARLPT